MMKSTLCPCCRERYTTGSICHRCKADLHRAAYSGAPEPKKPEPSRVDIYDSRNRDRLLGSIPRPDVALRWPRLSMAVMEPFRWDAPPEPRPVSTHCNQVDFDVDYRPTQDGWTKEAVFATSASLDLLRRITGFRLPGETEDRRWRW